MQNITRDDLYSLEQYAAIRPDFRKKVLAHKKNRKIVIAEHACLYFEDRMTMQYQIQEMLRIEKIFEAEGIEEELSAYNPLVPNGKNWKATFMIEYADPAVRAVELTKLVRIEDKVWVQIGEHEKSWGIADEDLERSNEEKTSAVHFMRFELSAEMCSDLKNGANLSIGIAHENFTHAIDTVTDATRIALINDLD